MSHIIIELKYLVELISQNYTILSCSKQPLFGEKVHQVPKYPQFVLVICHQNPVLFLNIVLW